MTERQNDQFRDNTYLCALDMTHATDEQQIAWLTTIIDNEVARGEARDEALICECAEYLELLSPEPAMSREECAAHLQELLAAVGNRAAPPPKARRPFPPALREWPIHRKIILRIAAVASAFFMIATLSTQTYAHAIQLRDNRIYEEVILREVADIEQAYLDALPPEAAGGESERATYENLSDFFDRYSELSFYYPHGLPRNQAIRSIHMIYCSEERWLVAFTFKDPSIRHYTVECQPQSILPPAAEANATVFEVDGREYITVQEEVNGKSSYTSVCADGNIRYTLTADHYDTACEILSLTKSRAYRYPTMEKLRRDWAHLPDFAWPETLPAGFSAGDITLHYDTQTSWRLVIRLRYGDGTDTVSNHALTVEPVGPDTEDTREGRAPDLSNEKTDIYILYSGKKESESLCRAECVVEGLRYSTKIFGYDPFMRFLNGFFGPF